MDLEFYIMLGFHNTVIKTGSILLTLGRSEKLSSL